MPVSRLIGWKVATAFLFVALLLSMESWVLGPYSYVPIHDAGDAQVPVFYRFAQMISEHGIQHWFPYHIAGNDEIVSYNLIQLITPLFMWMPLWLAFATLLVLQHFLGAVSMYIYCRKKMNLAVMPSFIAGISYTAPFCIFFGKSSSLEWWLNNYFEYRLGWGLLIPLLPLFFLAIDKAIKGNIFHISKYAILISITLLVCSFSIAYWPYVLLIFAIYAYTLTTGNQFKKLLLLFLITLISAALQIDQINYAGQIYSDSHRRVMDLLAGGQLIFLQTSLLGNFYDINLIKIYFSELPKRLYSEILFPFWLPFFGTIAILCIAKFRKRDNFLYPKFFKKTILSLVVFAAIISNGEFIRAGLYEVNELFARIQVSWYLWGIGIKFYASVFYGYLISITISVISKSWAPKIVIFLSILPVILATHAYKISAIIGWIGNGSAYANYSSPQIQKLDLNNKSPFRVISITGRSPSIKPGFMAAYGVESFDGYINIFPQKFGDFFLELIEPSREKYNESKLSGFITNKRYDLNPVSHLVYIETATELLGSSVNFKILDLANVKYVISPAKLMDDRLLLISSPEDEVREVLPLMGKVFDGYIKPFMIKVPNLLTGDLKYYLLSGQERIHDNFLGRRLYIYKNLDSFPRSFLVYKTKKVKEGEEVKEIARLSLDELKKTAVISDSECLVSNDNIDADNETQPIDWVQYTPNKITIKGSALKNGMVLISNSYSNGWRAKLNGHSENICRVDGIFQGILVNKGNFTIDLSYSPKRYIY